MTQSDQTKAHRKAAVTANDQGNFTKSDYGWRKRRPRMLEWMLDALAMLANPFVSVYHRLQRRKHPVAAPAASKNL